MDRKEWSNKAGDRRNLQTAREEGNGEDKDAKERAHEQGSQSCRFRNRSTDRSKLGRCSWPHNNALQTAKEGDVKDLYYTLYDVPTRVKVFVDPFLRDEVAL